MDVVHAVDIVFPPVRPFGSDTISSPGNVPAVHSQGVDSSGTPCELGSPLSPRDEGGVVVVEHFLLPPLRVFLTAMSVEDGPADLCLEVSDLQIIADEAAALDESPRVLVVE